MLVLMGFHAISLHNIAKNTDMYKHVPVEPESLHKL